MSKVKGNSLDITGELKVSDSLAYNVLVLTSKSGSYIGDITIVDDQIFDKLVKMFGDYLAETGEKLEDNQLRGGMKLPVRIQITRP